MKRNIIQLAVAVFCGISLTSCDGLIDPNLIGELATAIATPSGDYEYDSAGVPVFGYDGGQAVYGYAEDSTPIYDYTELTSTSTVPSWSALDTASTEATSYRAVGHRSSQPPTHARYRHGGLKASRHRVRPHDRHHDRRGGFDRDHNRRGGFDRDHNRRGGFDRDHNRQDRRFGSNHDKGDSGEETTKRSDRRSNPFLNGGKGGKGGKGGIFGGGKHDKGGAFGGGKHNKGGAFGGGKHDKGAGKKANPLFPRKKKA